jgi:hypothetical protein
MRQVRQLGGEQRSPKPVRKFGSCRVLASDESDTVATEDDRIGLSHGLLGTQGHWTTISLLGSERLPDESTALATTVVKPDASRQ